MKRTTIFRSSMVLLATLLAAPVAGGAAAAQDTLRVAAQDTLPAAPQGREHVVREGETLWAIAQLYYADAFLWPAIYRLNTLVVEDPHWIFPGEVLRLVPPDTTRVAVQDPEQPVNGPPVVEAEQAPPVEAAPPPPPPPVMEGGTTVFARSGRGGGPSSTMSFDEAMPRWPVRRGEFYAAGFLTEGEDLPWADVLGPVRGGRLIEDRTAVASAMLFEQIRIRGASGALYQIGDSLLTARLAHNVSGGWGSVVVPTGIVRVVHVNDRDVIAEVVMQFSRVMDGQVAMPIEPFRNPGSVLPQPVQEGIAGEVIAHRETLVVPHQQDIVFIDLGRQDGIVPGDVFEVVRGPTDATVEGQPSERLALLHIVHVRNRSASGMMLYIIDPGIEVGEPVRLIRKMPS